VNENETAGNRHDNTYVLFDLSIVFATFVAYDLPQKWQLFSKIHKSGTTTHKSGMSKGGANNQCRGYKMMRAQCQHSVRCYLFQ
jgi:hypothetical protein